MVKETEIKLRVSRTTLAALRDHPLLKKRNKSGWTRHELFNQYFDTPALDLGKVVAGKLEEEICELELELREGEPAALLELAAELAADLALMPCDISKAERGYRLFDANSYSLSLPVPELNAEMALDDAFAALAWHLLGSSQRLAEQYRFNGHWRLLLDWVEQLVELRALLGSLGQAAPRVASHELRSRLDALPPDWHPRALAGRLDDAVRQAAPAQFAEELNDA